MNAISTELRGHYEVLPVLAGAYRGKDIDARVLRTHAKRVGDEKSLCGRMSDASLSDLDVGGEPTCPTCAKRLTKAVSS